MQHNRNDKELLTMIGVLLTGATMLIVGSNLSQHNIATQIKQAGTALIKDKVYTCYQVKEDMQ